MTDKTPSPALDPLRARWRAAAEKDVAGPRRRDRRAAGVMWQVAKIGRLHEAVRAGYEVNLSRQRRQRPGRALEVAPLRNDHQAGTGGAKSYSVWRARPRLKQTHGRVVWHGTRSSQGRRACCCRNTETTAIPTRGTIRRLRQQRDVPGGVVEAVNAARRISTTSRRSPASTDAFF